MAIPIKFLAIFLVALAASAEDWEARLDGAAKLPGAMARRTYELLIPQIRKSGPPATLARSLRELAAWHVNNGSPAAALPLAEESGRVAASTGLAAEQATAEELLGEIAIAESAFFDAASHFNQAAQIRESAADYRGSVRAKTQQAASLGKARDFVAALKAASAALALAQCHQEEDWAGHSAWQAKLVHARLLAQLGRSQQAMAALKQLAVKEATLAPAERTELLMEIGSLYHRLGDPLKAQDTLLRGALIAESAGLAATRAEALKALGVVEAFDLGNFHLARDRFLKYQAVADSSGLKLDALQARLWVAELEFRDGFDDRAESLWKLARRMARDLPSADLDWRILYGAARVTERRADIDLALKTMSKAAAVLETPRGFIDRPAVDPAFLPRPREVFDSLIGLLLASAEEGIDGELLELMERGRDLRYRRILSDSPPAAALRARFGALLARRAAARGADAKKLDAEMAAIEGEHDRLATRRRPPTLRDLQARLTEGTMLVSYWMGPVQLGCLWVTRSKAGHAVQAIGDEDKVRIRQFIRDTATAGSANTEPLAAEVGELLLPFERESGIRRLIVVPDGLLTSLPFEALIVDGQRVLEKYEVSYLPAAAMAPRPVASRRPAYPWTPRSMWVAAPLSGDDSGLLPQDAPWLTGSVPGATFPSYMRYLRGESSQFRGAQAKPAVMQHPPVPLVHLAAPAGAGDGMIPSRMLMAGDAAALTYVTLPQIAAWDLSAVDLITLPTVDGDALTFAHVLLSGGARSVLTTLWGVDESTRAEFLKQFYFLLGEGQPKAAALREAKRRMAAANSAWSHPSNWAAFVLVGDGDGPLPPIRSWTELLLAAAAGVLITGFAVSLILPARS